jgi:sulfonate transport system substrate-binding protein
MAGWRRIFCCAATALLLCGTNARAEPLKIRLGWMVLPSTWAPLLYEKKELLKHYGVSYVVEPIRFQGTPLAIAALASGEIDISPMAFSSFATAIANAHMEDLRLIADDTQDGVEGYFSNQFTVLKDGPIRTVEDLKGKVLTTNATGGAVDIALRVMLRKHGLDDKKDVTIIEAAIPNMNAMLAEHKVDLITSVLPFSEDPVLRANGRVLFTTKDAVGVTAWGFWTARTGFIAANHDALVDFLEDTQRAAHWFLDPANRQEAIAMLARDTKQPPEFFDKWVFSTRDYYRDPHLLTNVAALQTNIDMMRELGFLPVKIDTARYVDLSLVKAAAERLQ